MQHVNKHFLWATTALILLSASQIKAAPVIVNEIPNDTSTGTTNNCLVRPRNTVPIGGIPITTSWIAMSSSDTMAFGVVDSDAGTTGTPVVYRAGRHPLAIDNTAVVGDFIQHGAGCYGHDVGNAIPTSGQIIGAVVMANTGPGTNAVVDLSDTAPRAQMRNFCKAIVTRDVTVSTTAWTTVASCAPGPFYRDPGPNNTFFQIAHEVLDITENSASLPAAIDFRINVNDGNVDPHGINTSSFLCTAGTCEGNVPTVGFVVPSPGGSLNENYPTGTIVTIEAISNTNTFTVIHAGNDANGVPVGTSFEIEAGSIYE